MLLFEELGRGKSGRVEGLTIFLSLFGVGFLYNRKPPARVKRDYHGNTTHHEMTPAALSYSLSLESISITRRTFSGFLTVSPMSLASPSE